MKLVCHVPWSALRSRMLPSFPADPPLPSHKHKHAHSHPPVSRLARLMPLAAVSSRWASPSSSSSSSPPWSIPAMALSRCVIWGVGMAIESPQLNKQRH
jgi:hypothetical protein